MANYRLYTVEIESAPIGRAVTDDLLEQFESALFDDRRVAAPAPGANAKLQVLEMHTSVGATGPANALAIAELAFIRAAEKAGASVTVAVARVWLDAADDGAHRQRGT